MVSVFDFPLYIESFPSFHDTFQMQSGVVMFFFKDKDTHSVHRGLQQLRHFEKQTYLFFKKHNARVRRAVYI